MIKYGIKSNKIFIAYFYDIILKIILLSLFIKCNQRKIELAYSYINLKIQGTGNINIFSPSCYPVNYPTAVIINDLIRIENNENMFIYNFSETENNINNIKLIWDNPPISTKNLFYDCKNIIEIDLSNFNSSCVFSTDQMFFGCSSLISLDLSYFDTSKVRNMDSMFRGCSSLTSLNLSNFNTSLASGMDCMFRNCSSLTSLDLSNFDTSIVTYMNYMFKECSSLTHLYLSNFDFPLSQIDDIFEGCQKLELIDLKNVQIDPNQNFPTNLPNITICNENEDWQNFLSGKRYINCINDISSFNYNENENKIKCFSNNNIEIGLPCQTCGNNFKKK